MGALLKLAGEGGIEPTDLGVKGPCRNHLATLLKFGTPTEDRTPILRLKVSCPNLLDDRCINLVGVDGVEPPEPEGN